MGELGKRLKELRENKGLTMKSVSDAIDVPTATYKEWEYGRSIQGEKPYVKISEFFNISLHELLTGNRRPGKALLMSKVEQIEITLNDLKKELMSL